MGYNHEPRFSPWAIILPASWPFYDPWVGDVRHGTSFFLQRPQRLLFVPDSDRTENQRRREKHSMEDLWGRGRADERVISLGYIFGRGERVGVVVELLFLELHG